jgi:iron complex outermembrane receptor protein
MLKNNRRYNTAGTKKPGDPYTDETDNYTQTHYQLFFNRKINEYLKLNAAAFITKGKGYYEQYDTAQILADYNLPDYYNATDTIESSDLVRRLWLDNIFFGNIFSIIFKKQATEINAGGGWNNYKGNHYGTVNYLKVPVPVPASHRWYDIDADKKEYSAYIKWTQNLSARWQSYLDVQIRNVDYRIIGFRNNPDVISNNKFLFLNPKAGITYSSNDFVSYASIGKASKEPNRDDFESMTVQPKPEHLYDLEVGLRIGKADKNIQVNLYHMRYIDQLILTGKINDVGAYTRTNVENCYRTGAEISCNLKLLKKISVNTNITVSENKVRNFHEFIDNYDNGGQIVNKYAKTNLAFSPSVTANNIIVYKPSDGFEITLNAKFTGRQFLDNTSQRSRSLNSYTVHDARVSYNISNRKNRNIDAYINVFNIFSEKYESNGYTFSYFLEQQLTTETYYFPMAPLNFIAGLNIRFNP